MTPQNRMDVPYQNRICKLPDPFDDGICGQPVPCDRHGAEVAEFDRLMMEVDE